MRLALHTLVVTPSVGVAVFPADGVEVDTLLRNADLAMYFAKRKGPGMFAFFDASMNDAALHRFTLEGKLRGALERTYVLRVSAATIDRALRRVREQAGGQPRRRAVPSAVRRSVPVRTFSDWHDPPPGFFEADLVAHSGPRASGSFIQTLVLTDIATGWTECAPLLVREQGLLVEVLTEMREHLPFAGSGSTRTTTACS